jgi:hypothetical protein
MKFSTALFAIVLLLSILTSNLIYAEVEPNNSYQQANTINPNSSDGGALNEQTQSQAADNDDWWKITLTNDGSLYASTNATGNLDVDLYIFDINGETSIASGIKYGSFESVYHVALKAGTYYIRAYRSGGTGTYTIQTKFNEAPYANDQEPNNSYDTAIPLQLNSSSSGHIGYYQNFSTDNDDYWKVTIPYDGSLTVNVASDSADIDIYIIDVDGNNSIRSATAYGTTETITFNNFMPGTYYVRLYRSNSHGGYTITSEYTPTSINGITTNDTEKNDDYTTAFNWLTFNSAGTGIGYGHLGFYSNSYLDSDDYMTVTTTTDGKLTINTESNSTLDIDIYLYDVNGTTSIRSGTAYGTTEQLVFENLGAGKYYVRLYRATGYGSYIVNAKFETPAMANDTEPNNSTSTTSGISLNNKITGHLGYYSNSSTDYDDYYVLNLTSNMDSLYIRIDSESSLDADLYLINSQQNSIASSTQYGTSDLIKYGALAAGTYYVRVYRSNGQGSYALMCSRNYLANPLTAVKEELTEELPVTFSLSQNYPNPFNPETVIEYQLPRGVNVSLKIYDVLGKEVAQLVNEFQQAGRYNVRFSAGSYQLSSGIYFYRIEAGDFIQVRKFILMK